ncbi:hypothetical protein Pfo_022248 [Paulownia fortunei]|nr:hypothetical protein Pfo_022248 [Paulownia fortunei]
MIRTTPFFFPSECYVCKSLSALYQLHLLSYITHTHTHTHQNTHTPHPSNLRRRIVCLRFVLCFPLHPPQLKQTKFDLRV